MPHAANETLRKTLHIAFGFCAFALKWLPWWAAAGVAAAAVLGNWLLLHRIVGRSVARDARGYDAGIIIYPLSVLALILFFHDRLHYAAIGWVMLAFGDGVATLAGKSGLRMAPLPWNRDKSWGGLFAFVLAAAAGGISVAYWMGWPHPWKVLIVAVVAAVAESLPLRIDDNITVPVASAIALLVIGLEPASPYGVWPSTPAWLAANGLLAIAGYYAKSVDISGALGGWLLGAILILGAGWPLYATLLAFFVLGTLTTKLGYARKARAGLAQEKGGRRGFSHAFSNVGVAAICAIAMSRVTRVAARDEELPFVVLFMGIAALATAAADTTASEIGQLIGRRAFLPLTLRRVPVGTEGAISLEGTLAGLLGGFLVAFLGAWAAHYAYEVRLTAALLGALTLCAFLGSYLESIAGSWNRKRQRPVPNGALNFFNTAVGAVLFWYLVRIWPVVEWHRHPAQLLP